MTAIKEALNKAGITMPNNERIWRWLKDHPQSTGKKIAAELKIPDNNVATLCLSMLKRDMLLRNSEQQRGKAGKGFTLRDVMVYSTNPKMDTYELLPEKKKKKDEVRIRVCFMADLCVFMAHDKKRG